MNSVVGEIEGVAFEDEEGQPATLITIRVPNGTSWTIGKVRITPLDHRT